MSWNTRRAVDWIRSHGFRAERIHGVVRVWIPYTHAHHWAGEQPVIVTSWADARLALGY